MPNFTEFMRILFLLFLFSLPVLTFCQQSFNTNLVFEWKDELLYAGESGLIYNEVWGYAKNGREYGIIGSKKGTHILDITNIKKPELLVFIPGAYDNAINRDYHDFNGYLYMVCDQGPSTLQIVDLHYLPDSAPVVYDSDELFSRCHNIFIDSSTAHLYACSVTKKVGVDDVLIDLEIFDLTESHIPELLLSYDRADVDPFHDIYVKNDTAIGNNGRTGLFFYDFTDMTKPEIITSITSYDDQGYNHAGYTSEDGKYYYFGDETHGTDLKVVDISSYEDPEVVYLFNSGRNGDLTVAHNLVVKDNLLFVSYYHEGLQIYNLDDPAKPRKVGHYYTFDIEKDKTGTEPYSYPGFSGAWGVYPLLPNGFILVSDRNSGLFAIDISPIDKRHHAVLYDKKTVFPNPMTTSVKLVYPSNKIIKVELFDINGKFIEEAVNLQDIYGVTEVNFSQLLTQGYYILKVEAEDETFTLKLLKG